MPIAANGRPAATSISRSRASSYGGAAERRARTATRPRLGVSPGSGRRHGRRTSRWSARAGPSGPRACSFWVEMPISAPNPNSSPSTNRVDALTSTAAASTSAVNRSAAAQVARDDGLAVPRAVAGDVVDGGVERRHDPHRELQVEELVRPVVLARGGHPVVAQHAPGLRSSPTSSTPSSRSATRGRNSSATASCTSTRLGGVAHRRPLRLAVDDDVGRHGQVGGRVDVDVAVAVAVDHVRAPWRCRGSSGSATARPAG